MCKARLYEGDEQQKNTAISVLVYTLQQALKLLHPIMPFITEEIYVEMLQAGESIMISDWPVYDEAQVFAKEAEAMEAVMDITRNVRNIRAQMNVPPSRKAKIFIATDKAADIEMAGNYIRRLASASEVEFCPADFAEPAGCAAAITAVGKAYLPLGDLIDIDKELERLAKEKDNLEAEVKRAQGKLSNERFVSKAPEKVVAEEKEKLAKYEQMLAATIERIASMQALK